MLTYAWRVMNAQSVAHLFRQGIIPPFCDVSGCDPLAQPTLRAGLEISGGIHERALHRGHRALEDSGLAQPRRNEISPLHSFDLSCSIGSHTGRAQTPVAWVDRWPSVLSHPSKLRHHTLRSRPST